jgi:hypothetical protein
MRHSCRLGFAHRPPGAEARVGGQSPPYNGSRGAVHSICRNHQRNSRNQFGTKPRVVQSQLCTTPASPARNHGNPLTVRGTGYSAASRLVLAFGFAMSIVVTTFVTVPTARRLLAVTVDAEGVVVVAAETTPGVGADP